MVFNKLYGPCIRDAPGLENWVPLYIIPVPPCHTKILKKRVKGIIATKVRPIKTSRPVLRRLQER